MPIFQNPITNLYDQRQQGLDPAGLRLEANKPSWWDWLLAPRTIPPGGEPPPLSGAMSGIGNWLRSMSAPIPKTPEEQEAFDIYQTRRAGLGTARRLAAGQILPRTRSMRQMGTPPFWPESGQGPLTPGIEVPTYPEEVGAAGPTPQYREPTLADRLLKTPESPFFRPTGKLTPKEPTNWWETMQGRPGFSKAMAGLGATMGQARPGLAGFLGATAQGLFNVQEILAASKAGAAEAAMQQAQAKLEERKVKATELGAISDYIKAAADATGSSEADARATMKTALDFAIRIGANEPLGMTEVARAKLVNEGILNEDGTTINPDAPLDDVMKALPEIYLRQAQALFPSLLAGEFMGIEKGLPELPKGAQVVTKVNVPKK